MSHSACWELALSLSSIAFLTPTGCLQWQTLCRNSYQFQHVPWQQKVPADSHELLQLLYLLTHLTVEQILVHPRNRGNLGLNPWNVHTIGAEVQKTGAKKEVLRSVAIEMSPKAEVKQKQIDFNEKLVERADGKLAKVNGSERAMSIGGSHLAAFCKAANKSCTTPQPSLQDEDEDEDGITEDEKGTSSSQLQG